MTVRSVSNNFYKINRFTKSKVVNEMCGNDLNSLFNIIFAEDCFPYRVGSIIEGLRKIGHGSYGHVFEYIGSDGYEYAVKLGVYDTDKRNERHDAEILEELQGIEGFPKLFAYFTGEFTYTYYNFWNSGATDEVRKFFVMISQKINGFPIGMSKKPDYNEKIYTLSKKDLWEQLSTTLLEAMKIGFLPFDAHYNNVMFDENDGIVYVIDVGLFRRLRDDEKMMDVKYYLESSEDLQKACALSNKLHPDNIKFPSVVEWSWDAEIESKIESKIKPKIKIDKEALNNMFAFSGKGVSRLCLPRLQINT